MSTIGSYAILPAGWRGLLTTMLNRNLPYLTGLVHELRGLPRETEWVEFKHNNADPQEIGEYVSALANSAALNDRAHGYLLWGVEDGTHAIVGTNFSPAASRRGTNRSKPGCFVSCLPARATTSTSWTFRETGS